MRRTASIAVSLALVAAPALACSPIADERSAAQIRAQSQPVAVDRACRMINGGVYDNLTLDRAFDVGQGRVSQAIGETGAQVLVADCNTREATILRGAVTSSEEGPCATFYRYAPVTGAGATIDLTAGATLSDMVAIAERRGASERNPIEYFFEFEISFGTQGHEVGRRDRFNLLCGCGLYYPNSAGAS